MVTSLRLLVVFTFSLLSVACATSDEEREQDRQEQQKEPGALDLILCSEPRPQICTREYDPVCAVLQDGSVKTYATGCTSCSDAKVEGYKKGACGVVSLHSPESTSP